jgi:hypothetical protein
LKSSALEPFNIVRPPKDPPPDPTFKAAAYGLPLVQLTLTVEVAVRAVALAGLYAPKFSVVAATRQAELMVACTVKVPVAVPAPAGALSAEAINAATAITLTLIPWLQYIQHNCVGAGG